jgi:HAD superfamily hydrolase (TIGR01490 family)
VDIDGTLFRWQLFHELVYKLDSKGLFTPDTSQNLKTAFMEWRGLKISWHEYESTVVSSIQENLKNISNKEFENAAKEVVETSGHKVYAYTAELIKELKSKGYFLLAMTGSQQEVADIFAQKHGFDKCIGALHKRTKDGGFDGSFERFVIDKKDTLLKEFIENNNLTYTGSYGIGDSDGDIKILELVDHPISFNPTEKLMTKAKEKGWPIVIERKNLAYTLIKKGEDYVISDTKVF